MKIGRILIIGASFSGLVCAYYLKKTNPSSEVIILEKNSELGKKIKATGNGKCNFTNHHLNKEYYNHPDFVEYFIHEFDDLKTIQMFKELGMLDKELSEGRVYPYTEQAITVVKAFDKMIKDYHLNLKYNQEVIDIKYQNKKYLIKTIDQSFNADYLVIACGGMAYPSLGSSGSIYQILNKFNLNIINPVPGLTGFKTSNKYQKMLDGLRFKGLVKVGNKTNNKIIFSETGEVQFKADGISGIVIMNSESVIARDILLNNKALNNHSLNNYQLMVDFYENYSIKDLDQLINDDLSNLSLIVPSQLSDYLLKITKDKQHLIYMLKHFEFNLIEPYDFTKAQVSIGGVNLNEVNNQTLEVKKYPHMYIIGECLDIDGLCGGFNIQWAMSSGYMVGSTIGEKDV